jgi:hypothetical protein
MEVKDGVYQVRGRDERTIQVRKSMSGYWKRFVNEDGTVMRFEKVAD